MEYNSNTGKKANHNLDLKTILLFSFFILLAVTYVVSAERWTGEAITDSDVEILLDVPSKLFDITFTIDNYEITSISELSGIVTYTSFGSDLTPVNYEFTLKDSDENLIKKVSGYLEVETEMVTLETFEDFANLDLPEGKYSITYTSVYNVDVRDNFVQNFTIIDESSIFKNIVTYLIAFLIISVIVTGFILSKRK